MTWPVVARRDFRMLVADNTLTIFTVFFAILAAGISYGATSGPALSPFTDTLSLLFLFAMPLTAGTLAHEAVPTAVGSGRIRLTLSLPHTRTEFIAGAGAARFAALLAAVAASVVAGGAVHLLRDAPLSLVDVAATGALTALLCAAYVAATLAFTARTSSATLAAVTAYGFFLLSFVWPAAIGFGTVLLTAQFGVTLEPGTADTVVQLSPIYAYQNALAAAGVNASGPVGFIPEWGGVIVLLAWTVGGFALAAHRFGRREF
jgi:ABC-type transport system involved in multi-copper enzyme maturation permease subunit